MVPPGEMPWGTVSGTFLPFGGRGSVGHLELAARPGPGGDDDLHDLAGRRLDLHESRGSRGEEGEHEERCADA